MPPLTPWTLASSFRLDPLGICLAVGLTFFYVDSLRRVRRDGVRWPWMRSVIFFAVGVSVLVFATCGGLATYRSTVFWVAAVQATVLSAVVPMGLALGDPVALARRAGGEAGARRIQRLSTGPVARFLTFPLVSSLLAVISLIVVFFTGYLATSMSSVLVRDVLYLQLLITGSLVVVPLLSEDVLPAWCTHPVRAMFAFIDGLLDAVPGILVMTAPTLLTHDVPGLSDRTWGPTALLDQRLGGGAMIAVAEVIGLPVLAAIIAAWVRADEADAREVDAALDALAVSGAEPERIAPWWETDPRFLGRRD